MLTETVLFKLQILLHSGLLPLALAWPAAFGTEFRDSCISTQAQELVGNDALILNPFKLSRISG